MRLRVTALMAGLLLALAAAGQPVLAHDKLLNWQHSWNRDWPVQGSPSLSALGQQKPWDFRSGLEGSWARHSLWVLQNGEALGPKGFIYGKPHNNWEWLPGPDLNHGVEGFKGPLWQFWWELN